MSKSAFPKKYVVYLCRRCGAAGYMRTERKGAICRQCGQRNELILKKMKVVLWTDYANEALVAVQVTKFKRKTFNVKTKLQPRGMIL